MRMPTTTSSDSGDRDLRSPLIPPAKKSEPEKLCIDAMLQKYCGEFGFWQLKHFVLTSLAWALEAFHTMVMIFADREPGWRCVDGGPGSGCTSSSLSVCGLEPGSWEWIGGPTSSTVAEWGLICGDKYKVGLVQALFFGGCMIDDSLLFAQATEVQALEIARIIDVYGAASGRSVRMSLQQRKRT
uniref:Organic cation/carnitine transporter 4-like n=1 Tax=Davidia involucrata TaxID=16924 RepID=A0A5B6YRA3_DAVIN